MNAQTLFNQLRLAMNGTHRVPIVIKVGGQSIEVESIGLEGAPGGRFVVALTPRQPLRLIEQLPSGVTELRGRRRD